MPTPTYTALATTTLASDAATVTFSNISQAYTDLILVSDTSSTSNSGYLNVYFNPTNNVMQQQGLFARYGYGMRASQYQNLGYFSGNSDVPNTNTRALTYTSVLGYTSTAYHKVILLRHNQFNSAVGLFAGRYASTSAITSVRFELAGNSFAAGSRFSLFGVTAS